MSDGATEMLHSSFPYPPGCGETERPKSLVTPIPPEVILARDAGHLLNAASTFTERHNAWLAILRLIELTKDSSPCR